MNQPQGNVRNAFYWPQPTMHPAAAAVNFFNPNAQGAGRTHVGTGSELVGNPGTAPRRQGLLAGGPTSPACIVSLSAAKNLSVKTTETLHCVQGDNFLGARQP